MAERTLDAVKEAWWRKLVSDVSQTLRSGSPSDDGELRDLADEALRQVESECGFGKLIAFVSSGPGQRTAELVGARVAGVRCDLDLRHRRPEDPTAPGGLYRFQGNDRAALDGCEASQPSGAPKGYTAISAFGPSTIQAPEWDRIIPSNSVYLEQLAQALGDALITHRQTMAAAEQSRQVAREAYDIAHRFRHTLQHFQSVTSVWHLVCADVSDEHAAEALDYRVAAHRELDEITEYVRQHLRAGADGRGVRGAQPVSMVELVRQCVEKEAPFADSKAVRLALLVEPTATGDPEHVWLPRGAASCDIANAIALPPTTAGQAASATSVPVQ